MQENLLDTKAVAKKLKVTEATIRQWIRKGLIPAINVAPPGRRPLYRMKEEDANKMLKPTSTTCEVSS